MYSLRGALYSTSALFFLVLLFAGRRQSQRDSNQGGIRASNSLEGAASPLRCLAAHPGGRSPLACSIDNACVVSDGTGVRILSGAPPEDMPKLPVVASAAGVPTVTFSGGVHIASSEIQPRTAILHNICCTGHIAHHMFDDVFPIAFLADMAPRSLPAETVILQPGGRETFWHSSLGELVASDVTTGRLPSGRSCFASVRVGSAFGLWSASIRRTTAAPLRRRAVDRFGLAPLWPTCDPTRPPLLAVVQRKSRPIVNLDAVVELGKRLGFNATVLRPERDSFEAQVELSARADVFVYVHGAALVNMLFMAPGAIAVTVFPHKNLDPVLHMNRKVADAFQVKHHVLRAGPDESWRRDEVLASHSVCQTSEATPQIKRVLANDTDRASRSQFCPGPLCLCETQYWNDQRVSVPLAPLKQHIEDHLAEKRSLCSTGGWDPAGMVLEMT
mmetsp:Transcript_23225/g.74763  ORF Transcript_23225/g.74763 Transcript_23225/m.74763 type:complete len:445 (+) Transcript_23225:987-2321(+)